MLVFMEDEERFQKEGNLLWQGYVGIEDCWMLRIGYDWIILLSFKIIQEMGKVEVRGQEYFCF